jgi:8-oxo-dGTP pyrophosphatase MutT (NUDIX family)
MPHIHSEPGQYDFTASAVIIRIDQAEPTVFLHKHLLSGKWTQPGGHVELHESPWSAVLHEITEESGYTPGQLKVLQPRVRIKDLGHDAVLLPQPACIMAYGLAAHKDHFHTDITYVFTAASEPEETLQAGESTETKYFTHSALEALSPEEIPDNVRQTLLFALDECLANWEAVEVGSYRLGVAGLT